LNNQQKSELIETLLKAIRILEYSEDDETSSKEELKWKTFNEWSYEGYKIIKGSKGIRVDGKVVFSSLQVMKKNEKPIYDGDCPTDDYPTDDDPPF
jgi:hypothetical protein